MEFKYKARNIKGGIQTGTVKSPDELVALEALKKNNLDVFYLEPVIPKGFSFKGMSFLNRIRDKDLVIFSRQLSILIESSIPIIRALRTIAEQTENPTMSSICRKMGTEIEEGKSFSEALEEYPKVFDRFFVNIVGSGEASGNLERSLNYLADHVEKAYELRRKIKGAMMYPGVILTAFTGVFFFLSVKVLPQLMDILRDSGVKLPWTTRVVMLVADFMEKNWILVLIALVGIVIALVYYFKTESGNRNFDVLILKVPIIGIVMKYAYITRFAENLRVLLKEGVSIVKALRIIAEVMDNEVYREIIIKIIKSVEKGKSMTEAMFENEEAFPIMVPQMIKIGEEAGRTVEILENIEKFYGREVDNITENLTTIIEPLLIVVLGAGTGILVAAVIMPIYDMAGAL